MACIGLMLSNISLTEVSPEGYQAFVNTTLELTRPKNTEIATTYVNVVTPTLSIIALMAFLIVVIVFIIALCIFWRSGLLNEQAIVVTIIVGLVFIALYYLIAVLYIRSSITESAAKFQKGVVTSGVLTLNSILRDVIYVVFHK